MGGGRRRIKASPGCSWTLRAKRGTLRDGCLGGFLSSAMSQSGALGHSRERLPNTIGRGSKSPSGDWGSPGVWQAGGSQGAAGWGSPIEQAGGSRGAAGWRVPNGAGWGVPGCGRLEGPQVQQAGDPQ